MSTERSRIVLMGSGETAPAMVKTHRAVLAACPPGPAVMLDTPFGFQVNADDLTARTRRYFSESVGREVSVASWRSRDLAAVDAERALTLLSEASWLFAGPGSPTYALAQWRDTPVAGAIEDVLRRDGTVVLGSAAAVTAGRWALPVYEIYKVGEAPHWAEGLDLFGRLLDLPVAVVPHFDNNEGGSYDTRFCYLGRQRLDRLLTDLPPDAAVLGVDEHTAVVIDLVASTVDVQGAGHLTVVRPEGDEVVSAGTRLSLDQLRALVHGSAHPPVPGVQSRPGDGAGLDAAAAGAGRPEAVGGPSLVDEVMALRRRFDAAIGHRDVDAAVVAILAVDDAMIAWSADTLQSDAVDQARRQLRAMVVRLGDLAAAGVHDPQEVLAPLVEATLAARSGARERREFATADLLREVLTGAGVQVNDTPDGAEWSLDDEGPDTATS